MFNFGEAKEDFEGKATKLHIKEWNKLKSSLDILDLKLIYNKQILEKTK